MNKEYDVVILGSGASGMMSAITAHENGSSVGLFEKQSLGRRDCWRFRWYYMGPHEQSHESKRY